MSRLFWLSRRRRDRRAVARVPFVWLSHLSRHVLDCPPKRVSLKADRTTDNDCTVGLCGRVVGAR